MWGSSPTFFFFWPPMPADALLQLIREHVAGLGFELADLRRTGAAQRPTLQVRVDRADRRPGHGVTADDCASVSRSLERLLEARAMVGPHYVLEVSSPGLERPLRWVEQWRRFVGSEVRVRARALPGRPTVRIVALPDDAHVTLALADGSETTLALDDIHEATLVVAWPAVRKTTPKGAD